MCEIGSGGFVRYGRMRASRQPTDDPRDPQDLTVFGAGEAANVGAGPAVRIKGEIYADLDAGGGRGGRGRDDCRGVLKLVFRRGQRDRHAVQHSCSRVGPGWFRRRAEDRDDRRRGRGHQCAGLHPVFVAPDTATTSKCNGSCAQIWPPVTGPATAGQGVTGRLGTSSGPMARSRPPTTGTLCTPTPPTPPGPGQGQRHQRGRRRVARGDSVRGGGARESVRRFRRGRLWILTAPVPASARRRRVAAATALGPARLAAP
jgi:hypothetical protein